jgi:hypothetical protein
MSGVVSTVCRFFLYSPIAFREPGKRMLAAKKFLGAQYPLTMLPRIAILSRILEPYRRVCCHSADNLRLIANYRWCIAQ